MPNSQCSYEGDESIASIDKLLSKLPPPEKIIEPSARKALAQPDPAFKDPLVTEIVVALNMRNFQLAMGLSRKLTERYPRSAGAQALRGALAYDLRLYAEASAAFRTATTIDPKYPFAYFGLAAVEATQGKYAAAIPHLQQVLKLQPDLTITGLKVYPGMTVTAEILIKWAEGFRRAGLPEE